MKTSAKTRRRKTASDGVFSPAAASFIADAVADGLAIQNRFQAEPVYARTGVGYMAPSGISIRLPIIQPDRSHETQSHHT